MLCGLALIITAMVAALLAPTPSSAVESAIDTFDRQAVIDHHDAVFAADEPDAGWTGDLSTCAAGTTSPEYRSATINRVNWYRSMAGLGPVTEDIEGSKNAQEAAAMNAAQNAIDHDPAITANYACQTQVAITAAETSNLAIGSSGPLAIDRYVRDVGVPNLAVGHRSWILSPSAQEFGVGDVPRVEGKRPTNVLLPSTSSSAPIATQHGFIAWPAPGFVPSTSVYARWSFALPRPGLSISVDGAEVTMERVEDGHLIDTSVIYEGHNNGAPVNVIVWEPALDFTGPSDSLPEPGIDETYRITISGLVSGTGTTVTYRYDVTVIGDAAATNGPQAAVRTEVAAAAGPMDPDHAFTQAAHRDFLGRDATAEEMTDWSDRLDRGVDRSTLIKELTMSDKWIKQTVESMYLDTLGRASDAGGLAYWTSELQDGRTVASLAAQFYSSPEYLARNDDNISSWVDDLYERLLYRAPDVGGLDYWVEQVDVTDAPTVAHRMYQSPESARARVRALYVELLGRTPDAGGEEFWAGQLMLTGDDLSLAAELVSGNEYYNRASNI